MAYMFTQGIENGYISIPTNEISLNNYNIKNLVPPAPGKAAGSMSELLSLHSEQYTVDTENTYWVNAETGKRLCFTLSGFLLLIFPIIMLSFTILTPMNIT